jgi:hypothetical protein
MRQLQSLLLVLVTIFSLTRAASDYHEQLVIRPLQSSLLLASFNFQSNTSWKSFEQQNFRYFPRSLGQILKHANTRELHLRFSLGQWDAESWGARPWGGTREGGTGVELWGWVEAETDEEYVPTVIYPSHANSLQSRWTMVDIDECIIRPVLRLIEFYRFYENNKASNVVPAVWLPHEFNSLKITPPSWHFTSGGCVHGEFDTFPETVTM